MVLYAIVYVDWGQGVWDYGGNGIPMMRDQFSVRASVEPQGHSVKVFLADALLWMMVKLYFLWLHVEPMSG